MFIKKKTANEDFVRCCATCEWATINLDNDEVIYCECLEKEKKAGDRCRRYGYDLLKREPHRHTEIPSLDPSLFEDDNI